jgi:hypothetical protein
MDLSPEERRRIYEEEKARIEEEAKLDKEAQESVAFSTTNIDSKVDDYSRTARTARVTSSSFAIAWSLVFLIFFNFFNKHLAYYQYESPEWVRYPILTGDFNAWLPIITTTLVLSIIGHSLLIAFDRYLIRESALLVLNFLGIAAASYLLSIFPFNFEAIPNTAVGDVLPILVTLVLVGVVVGLGIAGLVRSIKLIVSLARGTTSY